MRAAAKLNLVSVEDYLAGELVSRVKHEYLGGVVYAMAGRNAHSLIMTNMIAAFVSRLRGKSCQVFGSDTKIRVRLSNHVRFCYPGLSVVCRPNPQRESFQDEPAIVIEILSKSTRRIDEGEKKDAYLTIPSLDAYVLVEQEMPALVIHRRTQQCFVREVHEGIDAVVAFETLGVELPLAEIYAAIEFAPEPDEPE